jgi:uncharacterized damage-inducible protein DinB
MNDFCEFLVDLEHIPDELFLMPIAVGKWSILEIVAHIMAWDLHFLGDTVRALEEGKTPSLADDLNYLQFNERAAADGRRLTKEQLLRQAIHARKDLTEHLERLPGEAFQIKPNNGATADVAEFLSRNFVEHDRHHQAQIQNFLKMHHH